MNNSRKNEFHDYMGSAAFETPSPSDVSDYMGSAAFETPSPSDVSDYMGSAAFETPSPSDVSDYMGSAAFETPSLSDVSDYMGSVENRSDDSQGMEYTPFSLESLSKEELEALKDKIIEEYTDDNSKGYSR